MSNQVQAPTHTAAQLKMIHGINPANGQTNLPAHVQAALTVQPASGKTYASQVNAQRSSTASHVITIDQRWNQSLAAMPQHQQALANHLLTQAISEFRRRNPHIKSWNDLDLVEAKQEIMSSIFIDTSMQRQLDVFWLIQLVNNFSSTLVMPIQIYRDANNGMSSHAWDGQHTLLMLWVIATQILNEDPNTIMVPVNLYKSHLKAEMRNNFITLNSSEGKKHLDPIDHLIQQIFGVRVDGSKNPTWLAAEKKQRHAEDNDLFYTAKKFGDAHMPGGISRLQEINKLDPQTAGWLCKYLGHSTGGVRNVQEKEMVMMAKFFELCASQSIKVDDQYIRDLYTVMDHYWGADLDDTSDFWTAAAKCYYSWHARMGFQVNPRFDKNPPLGMPYMLAQLARGFQHKLPSYQSNSGFVPLSVDLA